MKQIKVLVSAILAGWCIGFGGIAFLSVENKILGSLFFTVGLFVICTMDLNLYTGKVCYILEQDKSYKVNIPIIWVGNLIGTGMVARMANLTRIASIAQKAQMLCEGKLNDSTLSIFILAIFCNICIYIGVEGFKRNPHEIGKYLSLFFGVMVFILAGFEHSVANMFYLSLAGVWSGKAIIYLLVMTAGNAVGGVAFSLICHWLIK